jgi:hypothetical protein
MEALVEQSQCVCFSFAAFLSDDQQPVKFFICADAAPEHEMASGKMSTRIFDAASLLLFLAVQVPRVRVA